MQWKVGQDIWIRCAAKPGAFSNERLVIIESTQGPVSGFVDADALRGDGNGGSLVRGTVRGVAHNVIQAWITGSFFTTNGLANISTENAVAA